MTNKNNPQCTTPACNNDMDSPTREKFTLELSGLSVWLEPPSPPSNNTNNNDMEQAHVECIKQIMTTLAHQCGGPSQGVHSFDPHVTLLYNMRVEDVLRRAGVDKNNKNEKNQKDEERASMEKASLALLHECVNLFNKQQPKPKPQPQQQQQVQVQQQPSDNNPVATASSSHLVNPTSLYYFPYPKHANHNTGFGCLILLLLLEKTDWLMRLHRVVRGVFPLDQRHAPPKSTAEKQEDEEHLKQGVQDGGARGGGGEEAVGHLHKRQRSMSHERKQQDKRKDSNADADAFTAFQPHLSLVYAPESQTWLEDCVIHNEKALTYKEGGAAVEEKTLVHGKDHGHDVCGKTLLQNDQQRPRRVSYVLPMTNSSQEQQQPLLTPLPMTQLSVWSTRGTVDQWYRIASVPLPLYHESA